MKQYILRLLADLRFAISLLLLISLFTIIGTVIEQDQSIEIYKLNYPLTTKFLNLSWKTILQFGLNHVYETWWFFILIVVFSISLITCTFLQQFPAIRIAKRSQFFRKSNTFTRLKILRSLNINNFNKILKRLRLTKYCLFQQKNVFYCYRGLVGKIAPIAVHISLILILTGTLLGSFTGFKAQEIIPKSDIFYVQNLLSNTKLTNLPIVSLRINDFWIVYTKQKTINQFYSDVSLLNTNGNELKHRTISVNEPLIYKNNYYYQTDWFLIGLRFQILNQKIIEYPLISLFNTDKVWLTWISNKFNRNDGLIFIVNSLQGYSSLYNNNGNFLGNFELNEQTNQTKPINLIEILNSTGIQIKNDPGIPFIFTGFFMLILSTIVSYISYLQIWIVKNKYKVFIGGNTNRSIYEFELEFLNLTK